MGRYIITTKFYQGDLDNSQVRQVSIISGVDCRKDVCIWREFSTPPWAILPYHLLTGYSL